MTEQINSQKIAERLAEAETPEEFHSLQGLCEARRQEIRARLLEIAPLNDSATRTAAILSGFDAVAKLDLEAEALRREYDYVESLDAEISQAAELAKKAATKRAIPIARKKLPKALDRLRTAVAALDGAMAEIGTLVADVAGYSVAGEAMPLTDDELAELLALRDQVWLQRNVAVLQPPSSTEFPKAWALYHVVKPSGDWHARTPGTWLPDEKAGQYRDGHRAYSR